ncbi:MAG: hypothetical protein R3F59_38585 [Myxococcota bacterium]
MDRLRVRTYQPLQLDVGSSLGGAAEDREVELPDDWLRGFLQVQSAATLPAAVAELRPVDLYNILFSLRTRRAKKAPRALRFELVLDARPRVVIEPWETALESHGAVYTGSRPAWSGCTAGSGCSRCRGSCRTCGAPGCTCSAPACRASGSSTSRARLTVALTSWSESKWASTASFDALMPGEGASEDAERAVLAPAPRSAAAGRPGARARPHAGGDPHRPAAGVSARPGAR